MVYLLTAIGLSPGGSSTVHIYTHTIHRTIQNKQYTYIEQHNNFGRVSVCESMYRDISGYCENGFRAFPQPFLLMLEQTANQMTPFRSRCFYIELRIMAERG